MTTHLQLAPDPDTLRLGSGTERAIRVVLADDHALMRRSPPTGTPAATRARIG
jgi:hypothetical protein